MRLNHAFHITLYAVAQAPILAQSADALWLRFGPSLRVVCGRFGTSNLPDKHAELLDALKHGNADAARAATGAAATAIHDDVIDPDIERRVDVFLDVLCRQLVANGNAVCPVADLVGEILYLAGLCPVREPGR